MAEHKYHCPECSLVSVEAFPAQEKLPLTIPCKRCKAEANLRLEGAPAVSRIGSPDASLDVVVGGQAASAWEDIEGRQKIRDKIRVESGQVGLTMVGRNEFAPITEQQKELRTDVNEALASAALPSDPEL